MMVWGAESSNPPVKSSGGVCISSLDQLKNSDCCYIRLRIKYLPDPHRQTKGPFSLENSTELFQTMFFLSLDLHT